MIIGSKTVLKAALDHDDAVFKLERAREDAGQGKENNRALSTPETEAALVAQFKTREAFLNAARRELGLREVEDRRRKPRSVEAMPSSS